MPRDYTRFVISCAARTGSNMLVDALNSNPQVRCFGEVFNASLDFVPFDVAGYDNFDARLHSLRGRDHEAFLRDVVFGEQPEGVRAVGFKLLYGQDWSYPELIWRLIEDQDLRVIHLRRRNLLRSAVSWKIAHTSDVWVENPARSAPGRDSVLRALRHPGRAARALWRRLRVATRRSGGPARVTLEVDEAAGIFRNTREHEAEIEKSFRDHPLLRVFYQDLIDRPQDELRRLQSFLGVDPVDVAPATRRQNPQPVRQLLANYEELRAAFRGTQYAEFFE